MVSFIDQHRKAYGIEPMCAVLPIAPSTYYRCKDLQANPDKRSKRVKREEQLRIEIKRVWQENHGVYGARKVWKQLKREWIMTGRGVVERLMKQLGISGVSRGRRCRTTVASDVAEKPLDLVNRQFTASRPNQLWVADITYVATWSGFVYVAFVTDVYSDSSLDALEQALWARGKPKGVIHHSDRGSQYLSICYTERLSESGFNASVGSVGDSYDNALAESINALFKAEVIHKNGPWKSMDDVERATLTWVDWFNQKRLLGSIDDLPPAEYEMLYYKNESCKAA